jgi:PAS domain S-box-containing protein
MSESPNKILIVDDEPFALKFMNKLLLRTGFETVTATSGQEAISILWEDNTIDLVLLDLKLKDMNGYEVLQKIKSKESLSRLPVLIVTAKNSAAEKVEGLTLGADDYITKPFEAREFLARIEARFRILRLENELSNSQQIISNMFETAVDGILIADLDGYIKQANKACADLFGYSPPEIIGKNVFNFLTYESQKRLINLRSRGIEQGRFRDLHLLVSHKSGKTIKTEVSSSLFKDANNQNPAGFLTIIRDITEREKAQSEIAHKSKHISIINSITNFANRSLNQEEIFKFTAQKCKELFDFDLAILAFYHNYSKWLDIESTFPHFSDDLKSELKESLGKALLRDQLNYKKPILTESISMKLSYFSDTKEPYSLICSPIYYKDRMLGSLCILKKIENYFDEENLEILEQIANQIAPAIGNARLYYALKKKSEQLSAKNEELKKSQNKLLKAERLAAIGEFATKIVHEIRNPLIIIGGNANRLQKKLVETPSLQKTASIIYEETKRLESLLEKILAYSRSSDQNLEKGNITQPVDDLIEKVIAELNDQNIELITDFRTQSQNIYYDRHQIYQVLLNLYRNALDSMPNGGKLIIGTKQNSSYGQIFIKDTGEGIPPDYMDKLALPFFTTKEKGTGLGLAICHRIISEHNGFIQIKSKLNKGTTVTLNFPLNYNPSERA